LRSDVQRTFSLPDFSLSFFRAGDFSNARETAKEIRKSVGRSSAPTTRARTDEQPCSPRGGDARPYTAAMFHVPHDSVSVPATRSFQEYRYAIEAGLITPHAVRRENVAWENTAHSHTTRNPKRYHDHTDAYDMDQTNKENGETQCVRVLADERTTRTTYEPNDRDETRFLDAKNRQRCRKLKIADPAQPSFALAAFPNEGSEPRTALSG
jgi:hypothetical protein